MARLYPLFSSSSGNSVFVDCGEGGVLFDVGVSAKQTQAALERAGICPEYIKAVFITHEHSDHVGGLDVFTGRYNIPVYASNGTLNALYNAKRLTKNQHTYTVAEQGTEAAGMLVVPFHTSHDAAEPVGYIVHLADGRRAAVATDTGVVTGEIARAVNGCGIVYIESNHDVAMLRSGSYDYRLKQRILSDRGHLSNDACAQTLKGLVNNGTTRIVLAHLSRENNLPDIAFETSESALREMGALLGRDYIMSVAAPRENDAIIF